ncbi:MAG: DeoR/GlpR family DNA-binding transcription regulator [Treponema sp.]|jgi:DeoR family transcriptional regulator of aga operon/DeoR family fructose operon transcriptional repressor|nr:DeoR/GlpR family DNA-binding transcription regulator [Treponema sp.]
MQYERRKDIVEKITEFKTVKVRDLISEYHVSIETIRRDLEFLEEQGYLQRVYGGAVLRGYYGRAEPERKHREMTNSREKQAIGKKAASLISNGDSVFIDYGTTTVEMVRQLGDKKDLTVLTNAVLVAQELARVAQNTSGWRIILLGGEIRENELTVSGALTDSNLKNFYLAKTVIGIGGIDLEAGVTNYYFQEASTHRLAVERADTVIGLADYSKFAVTTLNHICPADKLDILVTDWTVPDAVLEEYRALGITVYAAQGEQ